MTAIISEELQRKSDEGKQYYQSPEWKALRQEVIERDGGKCTRCRKSHKALIAHHKVERVLGGPDTMENLESLCPSCHLKTHMTGTR